MSNEIVQQNNNLQNIWSNPEAFSTAARMANALSSSTIVPATYQKNEGNCLIAIEMANRLGTSPLMVMQNLYIVHGNPAWSSQYIIAMINSSKKYKTEIQYEIKGEGEEKSCKAFVEDYDGRIVEGPEVTMKMAKEEGWSTKNGSKWKTMPDVMLRYRAASFFGRLNCPDMIMGMYSVEEVHDGAIPEIKTAEKIQQEETVKSLESKLFNSDDSFEPKENTKSIAEKDSKQESLNLEYPDPTKKQSPKKEMDENEQDSTK